MSTYNLRSCAAAQNPTVTESANVPDFVNDNDQELNTTMIEPIQSMPVSAENDQLCAIMAGINDLTRAVSESRRDIDLLRSQIQQHPQRFGGQSELILPHQEPLRFDNQSLQNIPQRQVSPQQEPVRFESQTMPHQPLSRTDPGRNMPVEISSNYNPYKIYDLPVFSGKPEEWPLFYANFKDSTNEFNYNHRHNLMRLQKCLVGDAKEAVASLLIYPNDVPKIIEELEFRFGRPDLIVRSQLQMIQQFPSVSAKRLDQVITFATKVRNVVAFLKSANCSHHLLNTTLLEELVSKLPLDKQYEWARSSMSIKPYPTIEDFSNWVGELAKVISVMTINVPHGNQTRPVMLIEQQKHEKQQKPKQTLKCYLCNGQHAIYNCQKFTEELTVNTRWEKVKELKLCFCCLKKGHGIFNCHLKKTCGINNCKRPHHPTLHEDKPAPTPSSAVDETQPLLNCRSHSIEASKLFKIIPIKISGPVSCFKGFAIFDEGSSISLLDENISKQLGLKGQPSTLTLQWYGDNVVSEKSYKVNCEIEGVCEPRIRYALKNIYTVSKLNLPIQSFRKSAYPHFKEIPIEDYNDAAPILLLGLDNIHLAIPTAVREAGEANPVAIKTKLGWVACGPTSLVPPPNPTVLHIKLPAAIQEIHDMVGDFFATENFGTNANTKVLLSDEDQIGRTIMENTVKRVGERFEIGLLWKKYPPELPPSYTMAQKRLFTIEKKMQQDPKFAQRYIAEIDKYLQKGYARMLTADEIGNTNYPIWYLPHFGVINPHKPEKLRVVFDAAAKTGDVSLNTTLVKGPEQAKPLVDILLKFREGRIAVAADIREMFSQVKIRDEDQHAQRFLWRNGDVNKPIQEYVMVSMTFGAICSPCCAEFVKNQNAKEFSHIFPEAANAIINKHYVDDFVCSFDSEDDAICLCKEVVQIHSKAGFELRGFVSNSKKLETVMNPNTHKEHGQINIEKQSSTDKILGMFWNKQDDSFEFKTKFLNLHPDVYNGVRVPTKREMLKIAMAVFDPFGLIADFLLNSKIMVQICWKENIGWDDPIPESLHKKFKAWWDEFKEVRNFKIPRCLSPILHKADYIQLHVFVDASQDAFAAVCYLRIVHESEINVSFIIGKIRCAPKKLMSIPRLELQAAVLGVRLSKVVIAGHEFKISAIYYWSDSQTVISWIYSTERRFKAFVNHRVAEILENSSRTQWKWIPTNLNAADAGTRPTNPPKFIKNSLWITGPAFLKEKESCWPNNEVKSPDLLQDEIKSCLFTTNNTPVIQFSRFSSYTKLKRCVSWVLRFIKRTHSTDDLSVDEITYADIIICRLVQSECYQNEIKYLRKLQAVPKSSTIHSLVPYLDEKSLLRVNGRLDEAVFLPLNARRPIILPQKHYVSELIMKHYHIKNHHQNMAITINELRQKYWIPRIKSAYKKVIKKCYVCRYDNAKPTQPLMGTLPPDRVTPFVRPFSYSGVDLFGPFNVAIGRRKEKRWAVIFTCLTTRAAHIELAENLSADAFILCFRNFINRRGTPVRIRSDNGTNFIASQKLLKKEERLLNIDEITNEAVKYNIDWIFNCPANPSSGGCWERLIRIVKRLLLKTLKDSTPRLETLRSVLIEAENIINSRPLTEIPVSSEDNEPFTPNHFLLGCLNSTQTPITNEENICLRKQWRIAQNLKDRLWKRWVIEFLPQLMQRPKWNHAASPLQIDDIVLIFDSGQPRHQWLKGRVLKTYPSKDGQVRYVDVKTKTGVIRRPASKLAVMNLSSGEPIVGSRRGEC